MKILLIHTYYVHRGGEDIVFEQERDLLNEGNEIETVSFRNRSGWKGIMQFFFSLWNISAARKVRKYIVDFQPDIVHIHNWHFATGPLIIREAKKCGVKVIVTLHNYRLLCPSATLVFNGRGFEDSVCANFPWKAIFIGAYRNSICLTFWLAVVIWVHRRIKTWNLVDRYVVLTEASKEVFVSSSLNVPSSKYIVKPNCTVDLAAKDLATRECRFLYVGRLSEEKGIFVLLEAFSKVNLQLDLVGDGPLKNHVTSFCNNRVNVRYLGPLNTFDVRKQMRVCSALIFPSIWNETFGLVLIEALSVGCPVIASNIGSVPEIIKDGVAGLLFSPGNVDSLIEKIENWSDMSDGLRNSYCQNARHSYESNFTPEKNLKKLLKIYQSVLPHSDR